MWGNAQASEQVYPRPRGGTVYESDARLRVKGLSPPTRGNLSGGDGFANLSRSIPAHAGERLRNWIISLLPPVYPRPRGGTAMTSEGVV